MGKGKQHCNYLSPAVSELLSGDLLGALGREDEWVASSLGQLNDQPQIDPSGYATLALSSSLAAEPNQRDFHEILGLTRPLSREHALAFLMAIQMHSDPDVRWTKKDMLAQLNVAMEHLGGEPISAHKLGRWIASVFDPPWEPRTSGQPSGLVIGTPGSGEHYLLRNRATLEALHTLNEARLNASRYISERLRDNPQKISRRGLAQRLAADLEALPTSSEQISRRERNFRRALQSIILDTASVRPHQLPARQQLSEATRVLFALVDDAFNRTLRLEGALLYAEGRNVSGKEAEDWWRRTFQQRLGIDALGEHERLPSGTRIRVLSESSGTDAFDLIIELREPGQKPVYLTIQFKSYVDPSVDSSTSFRLCKLGGVRLSAAERRAQAAARADKSRKPKLTRPRTPQELAEEIVGRVHGTGAFANVSVDPKCMGVRCDIRQADQVVHRAEVLHPAVQRALKVEDLARQFAKQRSRKGACRARITGRIDAKQSFDIEVRVSAKGEVSFHGLTNACWLSLNTASFLTRLGAQADPKLVRARVRREELNSSS